MSLSRPFRAFFCQILVLLVACSGSPENPQRPAAEAVAGAGGSPELSVDNVVLITVDTLRADALGFAGRADVATPNLDRLAAEGVVFTRAQAHNVVTLPSHANILTGLYPYQHGIRENSGFVLPEAIVPAGEYFRRAGFATGAVVGAFPLSSRYGLNRGFDTYDDSYPNGWNQSEFFMPERRGDEVVRLGLDWWRARQGRQRFLWVHLYDPHAPYEPPEPYASAHPSSAYLGEIAAVDAYLGPLLDAIRSESTSSTLIVFTSDHGEALGAHGESTHGFFAYQPTLRVPLVLWARGLPAAIDERLARHVDLLPTMLAAAGIPVPEGLSGRSILDPPSSTETVSYLEALSANLNRGWAPLRGLIRGRYKYISLPLPELYDLEADPKEEINLIQTERRVVSGLRRLVPEDSEWPPSRLEVSEGEQALLLSLGYLSGEGAQKDEWTAEDDPKNLVELDQRLHRVIELQGLGDLAGAERLVREVIDERPMAIAYTFYGQILNEQGKDEQVIEVLQQAIETGYAQISSVRELALTLTRRGRHEEALSLLLPLRESNNPSNLNSLATALAEAGRLSEARETLDRVVKLEPSNPVAYEVRALTALRAGDWAATESHARQALAIDGSLSLAWNYLGGALYNQGQAPQAVEAWEKSVSFDSRNFDAMFNLAIVAGEIGDQERARRALQLFIATAPPSQYGPDIQRARGWLAELGG